MATIPISLQLYSVRNEAAADLLGTIRKVAAMGYQAVEFAGFHGHSAEVIRETLDATNLSCSGSHTAIETLSDENIDATIAFHQTIGCQNLIVPWMPESMRNSVEACATTGAWLTQLTERLTPLGLKTGFHAHDADMRPLASGETPWYLLAKATPHEFLLQYDTANGMSGGADPVQPILDWPGRSVSVHLKGWKLGVGPALVGEPDVPWERVFEACETVGGTRWYVVEHEDDSQITAMDAVDQCLKNLRALGK